MPDLRGLLLAVRDERPSYIDREVEAEAKTVDHIHPVEDLVVKGIPSELGSWGTIEKYLDGGHMRKQADGPRLEAHGTRTTEMQCAEPMCLSGLTLAEE